MLELKNYLEVKKWCQLSKLRTIFIKMKIAVYPGTFDPITYGHIDVISKSLKIFDKVVVATTDNTDKDYFFSMDERIDIINKSLFKDLNFSKKKVQVVSFSNLTIELCKKYKASVIIEVCEQSQISNMNFN